MSGILWDPSQQPDLVDALSSFATSALALSLAIPMFVVDMVCGLLVSLCGLITGVLTPVLELLGQGGTLLLAATGLEDSWSANHTLVSILSIYTATALVLHGAGTRQQNFSKLTAMVTGVLWITIFLSCPVYTTATHPQVVLLSLAFAFGALCLRGLFLEHSGYKHNPAETSLDNIAPGYISCVGFEAIGAMVIGAFGYPGLSGEDAASRYYCLVPFIAMQMVYFKEVAKVDAEAAVALLNGAATEIKEEVSAKIQEVKEVCGDKVAEVKEKIEAAVEKVVDENPEILEAAAKVEAAGEVAEEKVEELVEAVKETVETVTEIVEAEVEAVKADPLYKRLVAAFCSAVAARISTVLAPILNLASAIADRLATVPWASILLLLSTAGSHLLYAAAWHKLTDNPVAVVLPCLTLLLPFLLGFAESRLPAALPAYVKELATNPGSLAVAATTYLLVNDVTGDVA
jgi:DNA-binding Lrp family transcriptional regulator